MSEVTVKVKIKRIDRSLPLPEYQTGGSCAFDIYSRENIILDENDLIKVPSNLIIKVPLGTTLLIALRSSFASKFNVIMPNAPAIIDNDYCGNEDEIMIPVKNLGYDCIMILRGTRFAQGIFVPVVIADWNEVDEMEDKSRGGFGSTGDF